MSEQERRYWEHVALVQRRRTEAIKRYQEEMVRRGVTRPLTPDCIVRPSPPGASREET